MEDMNENDLRDLEDKLENAEKDLKKNDLDQRVDALEKMTNEQKIWIKNYENEVEKLQKDVRNIAQIRESLPDGCFRRSRLEP